MSERRPDTPVTPEGEVVPGQETLFSEEEVHKARQHWKEMPEFISHDLTPWRSVTVHFASRSDLDAFALLIEQPIGPKVKSVWYPQAEVGHFADKRYVTQEEES